MPNILVKLVSSLAAMLLSGAGQAAARVAERAGRGANEAGEGRTTKVKKKDDRFARRWRRDRSAKASKLVSGEIKTLPSDPQAPAEEEEEAPAQPSAAPPQSNDNTPRWERKWQADAAAADRRELSKSVEQSLDVTAEMFSETPKAAHLREEIKLLSVDQQQHSRRIPPLDLLLATVAVCLAGLLVAMNKMPTQALAFPLFLSFVVLRLVLDASLQTLGLGKHTSQTGAGQLSSSVTVNTVLKMLPQPIYGALSTASKAASMSKLAVGDICVFVVAYGLAQVLLSR
jgi:hypothetical protein